MKEEKKIEVGSVVVLKSGGPQMTVDGFTDAEQSRVSCVWFARHEGMKPGDVLFGDQSRASFPVATLDLA